MSESLEWQMSNNSRATRRMKHPEIPQEPLVVLTTETCSCIQNQRTCPHASTAEANRILDEFDACLTENCQTDLSSLQPYLENVLTMPPRDAERFARGWRISSSTRDVLDILGASNSQNTGLMGLYEVWTAIRNWDMIVFRFP